MQQRDFTPREVLAPQPFELGLGGAQVGLRGLLDHGIDDVRLLSPVEPLSDLAEHLAARVRAHEARGHGKAARGELVDHADVHMAVHGHGERTRDRCGRHDQHIGSGIPLGEGHALPHPEAVLLVDHHEPQGAEADPFLDERVRADDQRGVAIRDPGPGRLPAGAGHGAHQQRDVQPQLADALRVLFGEDLGGGHHGGLVPSFDGQQHGEEGDQGLPGAHIALEHAAHAARGRHVGVDLAQCGDLAARQLERQASVQRADELVGATERDSGPFTRGAVALPGLQELQEEELVVRESAFGIVHFREGARAVQSPERFGELHEVPPGRSRQILLGPHLLE